MQLGSYRLNDCIDEGSFGSCFQATDEAGRAVEVRLLDRAREDANRWTALVRHLRLLALLDHPGRLRWLAYHPEHETPYLVLPARVESVPEAGRALIWGRRLASVLQAGHHLGMLVGPWSLSQLCARTGENLLVDLTSTRTVVDPLPREEATPAGDVARLAAFLATWPLPTAVLGWLCQIVSTRPEDRPSAEEVEAYLNREDATGTRAMTEQPHDLAATLDTHQPIVFLGAQTPQVGSCLGRFELIDTLGEGAMGAVYLGRDRADGSLAAIKVLHARRALSPDARRRFLKEAPLLGQLDTPYVTRLVEANTEGDCLYIALEYVNGPNLGSLLTQLRQLDETTAVGLILDAARGLAVAHARGIVHRDVKPDNILTTQASEPPRAKMTDFGLARTIEQSESMEMTQAGVILGTPLYMAPERFEGARPSPASDVYGLAASLFHLLAGRPPFEAPTLEALLFKHLKESPPDLEQLVPETTPAVARLVRASLSRSPEDRPADAEVFARLLERAVRGEEAPATPHPRLPAGAGGAIERVFTWELKAPPRALWPYVSNTERLNRAIGLPPVRYTFRPDASLGQRRFAQARVFGMTLEWEEHPFEWVENQRMGVLREFTRGPFRWFISLVELLPGPGGGTTLRHTVRIEPRGYFSGWLAWMELSFNTPRALGRVYRRVDALLAAGGSALGADDAFEKISPLSGARRRRLDERLDRLLSQGVAPEAVAALGEFLASASAQELNRIRPLSLAKHSGLEANAVLDACLQGVSAGLVTLKWDVICPSCRIPTAQKDTLRELREHENCAACDISFNTDFASSVEMVFAVHPEIREPERGQFCAGGPVHSPHVVAQTRVAANETLDLELNLSEGLYRVRGPRLPWSVELRITAQPGLREARLDLAECKRPSLPPLTAGSQLLTLMNAGEHEIVVRIERTTGREDALTAAQATALPAFRVLFPEEILSPGQLASSSSVTLLLTRVGDPDLYQKLGEVGAFQQLQEAFRRQEEAIRQAGGAVVKVVDETLYAVFPTVDAAVRTALALGVILALPTRAAIQRGLVMVATINDRLDYFGSTVKQVAALLNACPAGELLLPSRLAGDPEVQALLAGRPRQLVEVGAGETGRLLALRVPLDSAASEGERGA